MVCTVAKAIASIHQQQVDVFDVVLAAAERFCGRSALYLVHTDSSCCRPNKQLNTLLSCSCSTTNRMQCAVHICALTYDKCAAHASSMQSLAYTCTRMYMTYHACCMHTYRGVVRRRPCLAVTSSKGSSPSSSRAHSLSTV
jgi:hypothetical protein